jgi:hypothetical protein
MSKREVSAASNSAMNSMQTDRSVDAVVVPEEVEKMEVKTEDGVTSAAPTAAIAPTLGAVGSSDAAEGCVRRFSDGSIAPSTADAPRRICQVLNGCPGKRQR